MLDKTDGIVGVVVGKFQLFHNGHAQVILQAMQQCERVLVVIGTGHSNKYPIPFHTVRSLISASVKEAGMDSDNCYIDNLAYWCKEVDQRLIFCEIHDCTTDLQWCKNLYNTMQARYNLTNKRIIMFGSTKDPDEKNWLQIFKQHLPDVLTAVFARSFFSFQYICPLPMYPWEGPVQELSSTILREHMKERSIEDVLGPYTSSYVLRYYQYRGKDLFNDPKMTDEQALAKLKETLKPKDGEPELI